MTPVNAASFGFATLVFQHGHGASLLGIEHQGFVDAWAPLFFFALLFGLSMDYQLFLLAAIKERRDATGDAQLAVREGIARTGRPITNAARSRLRRPRISCARWCRVPSRAGAFVAPPVH